MLMNIAGAQWSWAVTCPPAKVNNFLVMAVREKEASVEKFYGENKQKWGDKYWAQASYLYDNHYAESQNQMAKG